MLTKFKSSIAKFHEDEAGLEALQVVMILAIAAICLIVLKTQWSTIKTWFTNSMQQVTEGDFAAPAGPNP